MEKGRFFMLFGHSIKLEKERNRVSSIKIGSLPFELIKIDKEEENDTRLLFKGDCGRKMIDFMGLRWRKEKNINTGLIMSLKDVQEYPKYDQETDSLTVRSKKRSWISTSDDVRNDDRVPCWPALHKKRRTVRGPSVIASTSSVVRLPLVNAKENQVVNAVLPNPLQMVLFDQDPWKIKKILKKSDVNGNSRLMIGTDMVSRHILPHVRHNNACFDEFRGTEVVVWDVDTGSGHMLTFKRWPSSKSFVFVGGWTSDFVKRRNLKESDEIGLKWDDANSRLEFTLLHRNH